MNLNVKMEDLQPVNDTDKHIELITLQLSGLGQHAAFYVGENLIMDRVTIEGDGIYTINGLTQDEVDRLGFKQVKNALSEIKVKAQTQEYERDVNGNADLNKKAGDASPWGDEKTVSVTISSQYATTGDDTLLWTGAAIDGRGGEDTIQLRYGESLNGATLAEKLDNIEVLDLGIKGANSISGLTVADVISITDEGNKLTIKGAAEDTVQLTLADITSDDWNVWKHAGSGIYKSSHGTAELFIDGVTVHNAQGDTAKFGAGNNTMDGSTLKDKLEGTNILKVDLGAAGEDRITNLTIKDVLDIAGNQGVLEIMGNNQDVVSLGAVWGPGVASGGYTTYTGIHEEQEVTLKISSGILVE